ncbi:glycosyl transferase family 2 [Oceanidesulfovibrio indonesiensis]|uniref:Glycosyl transferase family 2 n=1 Tax=Oceanidesulfovibrio indonesiensis TaxID=54767 RepID=A0A7M3MFM5_9BACT|nr:glycosyltransferase [Oceanidesulfovibrio indonesiensis]TVM17916.1 glycosyl transferase family 2 [Oceanidesulfovibrio indonesiensis]
MSTGPAPEADARPLVSVVVPTYNQACYLPACLDSIMFQEYPRIEIIVVADPSPDATFGVLEEYAAGLSETVSYASRYDAESDTVERTIHPRYPAGRDLLIILNGTRVGHGGSYNQGMRRARGEFVTYVASDDIAHTSMIAELAAPLIKNDADFSYADMHIVDDDGRILRRFSLPEYSFHYSFADWYLVGVAKLYRRELHDQHGYFDETYTANDHECYLRFAMAEARFLHIPRVLYSVRSHQGREQDVHSPESWNRLMRESSELAVKARRFLKGKE